MKKIILITIVILGCFYTQSIQAEKRDLRNDPDFDFSGTATSPKTEIAYLPQPRQITQLVIEKAVAKGQMELWQRITEKQRTYIKILVILLAIVSLFACFKSYVLMRNFEEKIYLEAENERLRAENKELKVKIQFNKN